MPNFSPPPSASSQNDFSSPIWQTWIRQLYTHAAFVDIALAMPTNTFTVIGSPIHNSGTFNVTYNSQTAGTFLGAPAVGDGTPSFRAIVDSDIHSVNTLSWLNTSL